MKINEAHVDEKTFTALSEEAKTKSEHVRNIIRSKLISAATGSQSAELISALGNYGADDKKIVRNLFVRFVTDLQQSFAADEIVDSSLIDYAKDVGPQRVLKLKEELAKEFPLVPEKMDNDIRTFEDIAKYCQTTMKFKLLLDKLDWLDIVKALTHTSPEIQKKFLSACGRSLTSVLKRQMKELTVTEEESLEAQRRITRVLYQ